MTTDTGFPSTIYGPVRSWRFGRSLGVDPILETSTCSFNCIYCQLGAIQRITSERRVYAPTERIAADLEPVDWDAVDVVTISGSGEPTLALNLGEIIELLKTRAPRPIQLLTNATMLTEPEVRRALAPVDLIACKLDAPDERVLHLVNRPAEGVRLDEILRGIELLRAEHPGRIELQVMMMPATVARAGEWIALIERLRPDAVQLNTPRRQYPAAWYLESRGDHGSEARTVAATTLRTITRDEAREAKRLLEEATGVPVHSVFDREQ